MNSNFQFLKNEFSTFHDRAVKAEQLVITDPRTSLVYSRMALEEAINWMYANDEELEQQYDTSLHSLMVQPCFKEQFNHKLYGELFLIKKVGNLATHNKPVNDIDAHKAIEVLFYFGKWFIKSYAKESVSEIGIFDFDYIPKEGGSTLSRKQIKQLQEQLDKELDTYQEQLKTKEAERQQLADENELFKKQIEALQAQIEANKVEANVEDETHHPRNEAETRKYLIDVALREAGWDLKGVNDKEYKVQYMPKSTNTSETGYVDYVLWDDDGLPLALVEAKRTLESASKGENQAQLYADSLEKMHGRRPVMYYSNGYEIFLWDDQFYKQARRVYGFYTKAELKTVMFRRTHRKDIRTAPIDTEISGRFYQMRAIKSIAEHFAGNDKNDGKLIGTNRGALLVLATGTGKTRTSIAFSKVMLECNWAKRILFLADRTSLVEQAKRNFVKHLPEHTSVNLLEEKDNPDARFAFSTYQTMMGLIDRSRDDEARFYGVGHFDLIIIDEAHRSIYKKYQAIFEYFDALFLGLTATPKNSIDKNTYHIFGLADKSPTDAYTFEEAVANNHLTPYHTIEVPTKFLREGIKYDELSDEEKEEFEEDILDGEEATGNEWISSSELNTWLFNKPTAIKTLRYVLEHGIKKRGGDELGKTIIFAKNRKHAQFLKDTFMELDKEQFGNDYVKVITHSEPKAKEFINRFCDEEKERLPQIAISVDMMDTGIDAPSCVNLVFYKPVKSYAKFWQMIGRGSRLRPDLFGAGQDKKHFLIFDLCGNFEFFNENPEGIETSSQKSLTEILFGLRLRLAEYLKINKFKEDDALQNFRTELLDGLYKDVATLDLERFDVKMKLEIVHEFGNDNREIWNHLSKRDAKRLEDELAPLIKPQKVDTDLARYYDKLLYTLITKRLETPNSEEYVNSFMIPITKVVGTSRKLLKKTTIPAVKSKEALIKLPLKEDFWKVEGIVHLEKLRKGVRELVKYIDPEDQRYVTTDFEDYIIEDEIKTNKFSDTETPEYTSPFQNNIHRLEQLIRENENHITIARIRKGESITKEELQALEDILFKGGIDKKDIEKEIGSQFSLVKFIISLMGLSPEKVDAAFAKFTNDYQLNAVQIQFLDTVKKFLTTNGKIEPSKLYDTPFKNYHSMGIDGVFTEQQADVIFKIVENFNKAN
ncbi:type I restriction enzyme R subunit [Mesoflavibacter sabulilitoris]|uniref:Restriction endonuclease n=1 Tax=Mesoflavibacter zeaxanthinifaciens subsp. sabulilitoris TaxID=1520893 RepID=A0A2T1NAC9_9FLAO|nr:DEAD/DEAH box helicase family protein [Mesoflavibacter zeaxanthinifaciens]MBB3123786.1 type I restriction enzyme R subunit [Mesoflavibacter zeaxanthinifaciens subsp. sabulilitoris]PSG89096.1 restriction endonuclease [Mesoflavibacter zeaxanthinifaciens subsp. sabulilitoris]